MLRIHEIKLKPEEDVAVIPSRIKEKLGHRNFKGRDSKRRGLDIKDFFIVKESIDARNKRDIRRVYSVDFTLNGDSQKEIEKKENFLLSGVKSKGGLNLERSQTVKYEYVEKGRNDLESPPVIVGFGPCGMFAALILSQMGYRPIVLERGKAMEHRTKDVKDFWQRALLDEESNVQFGEGGAGTFSDGKLTTQIKDPRVRKVLEEFVNAGAPSEILYQQKPHIGTDLLRNIVVNIRNEIIKNGGQVRFQSKVTDITFDNNSNRLKSLTINGNEELAVQQVVLAIGHSARDTFHMLAEKKLPMEQKPFSIGVRIEHRQDLINEAQYGTIETRSSLGAADYKLSYRCKDGRGVYTFCMCPGGVVVGAASQRACVVTNGMSYHKRKGKNANSALLVDVRPEDFSGQDPLAGVIFQEKYEGLAFEVGGGNYRAPAQRVGDFLGKSQKDGRDGEGFNGKVLVEPSYEPGVTWTDLAVCLPEFAVAAIREALPQLGKKIKGFDDCNAVMTGVETRSSSPVRILRDGEFQSRLGAGCGLFPAGEGAGYAGGIVSAAVDGIKIAEEIARKHKE